MFTILATQLFTGLYRDCNTTAGGEKAYLSRIRAQNFTWNQIRITLDYLTFWWCKLWKTSTDKCRLINSNGKLTSGRPFPDVRPSSLHKKCHFVPTQISLFYVTVYTSLTTVMVLILITTATPYIPEGYTISNCSVDRKITMDGINLQEKYGKKFNEHNQWQAMHFQRKEDRKQAVLDNFSVVNAMWRNHNNGVMWPTWT